MPPGKGSCSRSSAPTAPSKNATSSSTRSLAKPRDTTSSSSVPAPEPSRLSSSLSRGSTAALSFVSYPPPVPTPPGDVKERKIHVSNVPADLSPEKLRSFFSQYGEVERGPLVFYLRAGKSREGVHHISLQDIGWRSRSTVKMFEGQQLYRVKVVASSQKEKGPATSATSSTTLLGPAPQPVLAAVAAAQNLMIHRHNPTFASLLGHNPAAACNPSPRRRMVFTAAAINPI